MKRILVLILGLLASVGVASVSYPEDSARISGMAETVANRTWSGFESHPMPMIFALGTFFLTVVFYKAKGMSLRESVEVAATRVTVIPVSAPFEDVENAVLRRAKARAMRTQLMTDRIGLENRARKVPEEVVKAEKDSCHTERAFAEAKRALAERQKAHEAAMAKLKSLRKEKAKGEAELAEIDAELSKLAELV